MVRKIVISTVVFTLLCVSLVSAGTYTVTQGSNSWDVTPVTGSNTIAGFYDYTSVSSHTGYEEIYVSKIYLYLDTTNNKLGLIMHHNIDTTGGSGSCEFDLQNVPAGSVVVVSDDAGEFSLSKEPEGNWAWTDNTDGGAIELPQNVAWAITVVPNFQGGIQYWKYLKGDGSVIQLGVACPGPVMISYEPSTVVPEFPTVFFPAVAIIGLLLAVLLVRIREK
ncbi:MAG: hypothetical protein JXA08_10590 [Methanomicrobiaceae archaeon]|nr:hypothetical protein [Methanomicrobiaceae archaeon]